MRKGAHILTEETFSDVDTSSLCTRQFSFIAFAAEQTQRHGFNIKPCQSLHVHDAERGRVRGGIPSVLDGASLESSQ